jgi:hypothetical protein
MSKDVLINSFDVIPADAEIQKIIQMDYSLCSPC